jgi:hypothetical protein
MAEIFMGARYRQHSRGATGGWDVGGRCTFGGPDEFGIRGPFEGWNRERIDRAERVSLPGAAGLAVALPRRNELRAGWRIASPIQKVARCSLPPRLRPD